MAIDIEVTTTIFSLKVLHLTTSVSEGAGIAAWRQHKSLRDFGIDSRVAVRSVSGGFDSTVSATRFRPRPRVARWLDSLGIAVDTHSRWRQTLRNAERDPRNSFECFSLPFADYAPEDHPALKDSDVIHLHWVSGLINFPRFFERIQKPLVWTLHDQNPYLGGFHYRCDQDSAPALAPLENTCRDLKKQLYSKHRFAVLGNSSWNTRCAETSGVFPAGTQFETVYYPLDCSVYTQREKSTVRRAFGLPEELFLIGFACCDLQNKRKGLDDLLEAVRPMKTVGLLSFGRPPDWKVVQAMPHKWYHMGFLPEERVKAAVYSAMDCFVAPSKAEAFGQTAIEAMACGVPVIAANVGGLAEATDRGRAGLLVPPAHPEAIRAAVEELLSDQRKRSELGEIGRSLVADRHAPKKCANQLLEGYRRLLDG